MGSFNIFTFKQRPGAGFIVITRKNDEACQPFYPPKEGRQAIFLI